MLRLDGNENETASEDSVPEEPEHVKKTDQTVTSAILHALRAVHLLVQKRILARGTKRNKEGSNVGESLLLLLTHLYRTATRLARRLVLTSGREGSWMLPVYFVEFGEALANELTPAVHIFITEVRVFEDCDVTEPGLPLSLRAVRLYSYSSTCELCITDGRAELCLR